ncbi:hypothetical protein [Enterobacter quasiroggenkampii]|uniref:hypothetical protein n=1 Tax=Enterobacter quasiroggenkampii TaxID=2497436 RepID=UPI00207652D7|nr:hypothetical protein [Enterobacter quasiroggenkampii]MCM7530936.1 hypothetical protein [Enterobacter quasiroggenkampii]
MITEKNNVFYCDCGFSFQRGRSGAHDCADGLRNKLAESEARCAALAAENAGLKKFCKDAAFDADYEAELGMERGGFTDALNNIKTPATDAFLAEVRAQGVEMFAAHKRERQQALRSRSMRMSEEAAGMAADAENFADELRKGVQS